MMKTMAINSRETFLKSANESAPFDMDVAFSLDGNKRNAIENFIQNGYKKAFNANISVTMPALLYIEDNDFKAALGIRGHEEPFFIKQYLDRPLITYIKEKFETANSDQVIEIGNLYSNSIQFTIPLFLVAAVTAFLLDKKFIVLCGTQPVLDLLTQSGVTYHRIVKAHPSRLSPSYDEWGYYYQTKPEVVYISLDDLMALIDGNKFYQKIFQRLGNKIFSVSSKMVGYL